MKKSNIVEQVIATPPASYEGYLYKFTNLDDGKMYVGIHKGAVDDPYNHSSENVEFQKVFVDSEAKLSYEVLSYGDYIQMQNDEHRILKQVDARTNPMYYNKSNGFPQFAEPDIENCKFVNSQIDSGVFPTKKEDIELHTKMSALQVRFEHIPALQRTIKEKIDDARGNTDACNPVLVWEGRGENGEDLRGDGNHTVLGAGQSKHAVDIPVMRIPYAFHCDLTDEELRFIGNLRNKKPVITKEYTSTEDGIKYVLDMAAKKIPYNAPSNSQALKEFGHTKAQIRKILDNANQIIETKKQHISAGRIFINYKAKPHSTILDAKVASYNRPDLGQCSMYLSSGAVRFERVLEILYANRETCKRCVVVIHHPSVKQGGLWKKDDQPFLMNLASHFKLDVEFIEMEMWMADISKKEVA
tara:strand:+ start:689 stop:1930 length:1242 start_codon:yes stop_codon:yes gene_type:complete